jgi:hypothetical protein
MTRGFLPLPANRRGGISGSQRSYKVEALESSSYLPWLYEPAA